MTETILIILATFPLALFIVYLLYIDAFSLTKKDTLLYTILWGVFSFLAVISIENILEWGDNLFIESIAEEFIKGLLIFWFVNKQKVALLGDATIYGSAVGAGFGMAENIFFVISHNDIVFTEALFKGFEAAVMHIGCTSTLAAVLIMVQQGKYGNEEWKKRILLYVAFLIATVIHYIHSLNDHYEFIHPIILTTILVLYFVWSKRSLFRKNEKFIHDWIDNCINNEIALLGAIKQGKLSTTNAGQYLLTLKEHYKPEVFFDMCCYISEYLELSIAAKSNLILKEAGLPIVKNEVNKNRIVELKALQKLIGITGVRSLSPIVNASDVDKWVMDSLL